MGADGCKVQRVYCHILAAVTLGLQFSALQYRGLGFMMSEPCVSTCRQEMAVMCVIIEICDSIAFAPSSSLRVGCVSVAAESHL